MLNHKSYQRESGNTAIIVLAALVIVAIGALAFFSGHLGKKSDQAAATPAETAAANTAAAQSADAAAKGPESVIKPGNPVVAKLKGQEVTRMDVFNFIQNLPPQTRQLPLDQLFPMAMEQVINARLIAENTKNVNLDSDAEVKKQLEEAKKQITRTVYLEKEVSGKVTEDRLKKVYDDYVKNFPDIQDLKASHILVKEESKAKDLIKQLDGGADFAELAKANSTDGTAQNGGDLGYFAKTDVVPAFGEAAFALKNGEYSKTPVKTDFGYHVIKAGEQRKREPAKYEEVKPYLEAQVRREILDEMIQGWREQANIERFNINGEAIEPSAGQETAPAGAAPATPRVERAPQQ